ncbi:transposase [Streptomyces rubradiris]|uniref:IS701 family transposase n=1 Tax=Streptomyces rubradiris TaxID=285531 RepID=UPI0036EDFF68
MQSIVARVAGRFGRAYLRWRTRGYVRGLLAPVGRKDGWQLAKYARRRDAAGLQHPLNGARWDADAVRDDLREYVGQQLGPDDVLIIDDTGFLKKGTTSAGVSRQYTGTSGKIDNCQIGVFAAYPPARAEPCSTGSSSCPRPGPKTEWCWEAKIPDERTFATKSELARGLVRRSIAAGLSATDSVVRRGSSTGGAGRPIGASEDIGRPPSTSPVCPSATYAQARSSRRPGGRRA